MSVTAAVVTVARGASDAADWLIARPRTVLGSLVGAQLVAVALLAAAATHNGWVYFQGGDQIGLSTTGWLVGQLQLPPTTTSYVWPFVLAPLTWLTGPTYLQLLPPLVLLQVVVLGPIALLCVYGIASRIGGRLLGYWASLLWVVTPFAAIPLFVERYHEKWIDQFLPQALGLTAMSDFPSLVLVLAAAFFAVRSLGGDRVADAALAGALAGAAGGLKPPNYLFVAGALLAFAVARRWREGLSFAVLLVPSVIVLAYWKRAGLGMIPALTLDQVQLAAGATQLRLDVDRYIDLDFEHWRQQMDYLREFFWSARVAQWAPIAGLLAVLRARRYAIAALLGGWLAAFLVVKGFSPRADIQANTFWRLLLPAWPAYLILFASIPLLVPTSTRRLAWRMKPPEGPPTRIRWVVIATTLTALLPAVVIASSTRLTPPDPPAIVQFFESGTILTPVDESIRLVAREDSGSVELSWSALKWRADVFYRVYRAPDASDLQCVTERNYAWNCYLQASPIATTRSRELVDDSPVPGAVYRVGVGTNWANDPDAGDVFVFSPPAVAGP